MVETNIIVFAGSLVLIFILQKIILALVKKASALGKIPDDVVNGLRLIVNFIMAILFLYSAVYFLEIGQSTTLILSVFLGSIISFASIQTIQNFVSGAYILFTEPFSVNDLVRIGGSEGVVTEISLNYTFILNFEGLIERIPNKKIVSSLITNFDQKVVSEAKYEGKLGWMKSLVKSIDDTEITRYSFIWGAPLIDLPTIKKRINKVCKKYKKIFGYLPEYTPYTLNHRFEYSFILRSDDPITILKHKTDFLDEISAEFH
ncbi:MAG: mechanosensitive ion channel [Candidatus Heimdallarchaeota archaeon]|nr:mechanosensitive ion channel [Candidatus Heimdallarchaeota archaeon]